MDLVVRAPRLPAAGETVMGTAFQTFPGGKGANQAVAAAKLGGEIEFVGCVGDDPYGEELRKSLEAAGVGTRFLQTRPGMTSGIASIVVDEAGRNLIVVAPGANGAVTPGQATKALDTLPGSTLLVQLEIPLEVVVAVLTSGRAGRTVLNPAPAAELPPEIYPAIDVITPNETEASRLTGVEVTGIDSAAEAASRLLEYGVGHAIVTLGEAGCYHASASGGRHYAAFPVDPVDTVAAGDAFSGALALFLSQGRPMEASIALAGISAALSTTKQGAQPSMPSLEDLRRAAPDAFLS